MKIRNENVECITCKQTDILTKSGGLKGMTTKQLREKLRACKKCANKNGNSGWEPAPGVNVQETRGWTFTGTGKPVETIFRRVMI